MDFAFHWVRQIEFLPKIKMTMLSLVENNRIRTKFQYRSIILKLYIKESNLDKIQKEP